MFFWSFTYGHLCRFLMIKAKANGKQRLCFGHGLLIRGFGETGLRADLKTGKAFDADACAKLGRNFFNEILDGDVGVLDEFLL